MYLGLGALFGTLGRGILLAGVQRSLSIGAGSVILIGLALARWHRPGAYLIPPVTWVKGALASRIRQRGIAPLALFGLLNGLLPCGLVYAACAGATATGSLAAGVSYMGCFGLGTVPMMLSAGLLGRSLPVGLRLRLQGLVPLFLGLVAVGLILRGMSLGIPYLSPDLSAGHAACPACH